MSMSSRASLWFGYDIQSENSPEPQPQPVPTTAAATTTITTPVPDNQFIYSRYFQKVTLRDFQNSTLLLQYAKERQVTPAILWHQFIHHVTTNQIENNLANLIEYLSITPKSTVFSNSRSVVTNVAPAHYDITSPPKYREETQKSYLEYNRRTFPMPFYTREDFLRSKREAEEAFERKMAEESKSTEEREEVEGRGKEEEEIKDEEEKQEDKEDLGKEDLELNKEVTTINGLKDCDCDYDYE